MQTAHICTKIRDYNRFMDHSYCSLGGKTENILIHYIKKNVEKRVKLDERKKCLYEWIPYIRILDQNNLPSKKYYWFGRLKYSAETNCMQRSAPRQAGFSFLYLPISPVFFLHLVHSFSPAKKGEEGHQDI